jgi:Flp pilus assembly protein TadD
MRVTRILDLAVLILLATVVMIPRPDVTVKPALALDQERRERVAELQSELIGRPDDADAAVELANIYLDGHRPDWALATVDGVLERRPDDYRLYHLRAIAYADRFEGSPAFDAATRAVELCDRTATCGAAAHARLALLRSTLEAVAKVDMRNQPYLAKERILEQLHPVFVPKPKPKLKVPPAPKVAPGSAASPAPPPAH